VIEICGSSICDVCSKGELTVAFILNIKQIKHKTRSFDGVGTGKEEIGTLGLGWDRASSQLSSSEITTALKEATLRHAMFAKDIGDVISALSGPPTTIEAQHQSPFLAYTGMQVIDQALMQPRPKLACQ
jgi:hypothetical protein